MLKEYRDLYKTCADKIPGWQKMGKNDLCRAYVEAEGDPQTQEAYLSAVMYRYWHLIPKYYYQSSNCATVEDCYEWLTDSVLCCLNLSSWTNPKSSIYKDPDGPDKVINRCMKCARLTYYQYVNRKKRKDNFGLQSIDELAELFGKSLTEPAALDVELSPATILIRNEVVDLFLKKDYFKAALLDCIIHYNVFDWKRDGDCHLAFNLRRLTKVMSSLDNDYIHHFSTEYQIPYAQVEHGMKYVQQIPAGNVRKKILTHIEEIKHSNFILEFLGGVQNVN